MACPYGPRGRHPQAPEMKDPLEISFICGLACLSMLECWRWYRRSAAATVVPAVGAVAARVVRLLAVLVSGAGIGVPAKWAAQPALMQAMSAFFGGPSLSAMLIVWVGCVAASLCLARTAPLSWLSLAFCFLWAAAFQLINVSVNSLGHALGACGLVVYFGLLCYPLLRRRHGTC